MGNKELSLCNLHNFLPSPSSSLTLPRPILKSSSLPISTSSSSSDSSSEDPPLTSPPPPLIDFHIERSLSSSSPVFLLRSSRNELFILKILSNPSSFRTVPASVQPIPSSSSTSPCSSSTLFPPSSPTPNFYNPYLKLMEFPHPYLAQIRGVFCWNQCLYLIISYIEGESLTNRLDRWACFSEDVVSFIFAQILEGVAGITGKVNEKWRRSINEKKIRMDNFGNIKISCFGREDEIGNEREEKDLISLGKILAEMLKYINGGSKLGLSLANAMINEKSGIKEAKKHEFFRKIDWKKIRRKKIPSPLGLEGKFLEEAKVFWNICENQRGLSTLK